MGMFKDGWVGTFENGWVSGWCMMDEAMGGRWVVSGWIGELCEWKSGWVG